MFWKAIMRLAVWAIVGTLPMLVALIRADVSPAQFVTILLAAAWWSFMDRYFTGE